tara:strand:- start:49124 stop:49390 length:267 start_codon:yes stop_codon:yes gene_type:complete
MVAEYPYQEGDDYYVLERLDNGKVNIIWSCWDDQSEVIYDEQYDEQDFPPLYFDSLDTVKKYCKATGLGVNQVYDYHEGDSYRFKKEE